MPPASIDPGATCHVEGVPAAVLVGKTGELRARLIAGKDASRLIVDDDSA